MDVTLVIPAFNERENLPPLVAACRAALDGYEGSHEIVLIDDGSTDGSSGLIDDLIRQLEILRPIRHPPGQNIGCHPSELEGLKVARGDVALFLPADLQIHPSVLPAFVEASAGADVVASRRVLRADARWRRHLSAVNNRVERRLLGVDVHDAHSSMLLTRKAIDAVVPRIVSRSALIPAEILVRAARLGLSIGEIDVEHRPRTAGTQTGARLAEILAVQVDLLRLRAMLRREARREAREAAARASSRPAVDE